MISSTTPPPPPTDLMPTLPPWHPQDDDAIDNFIQDTSEFRDNLNELSDDHDNLFDNIDLHTKLNWAKWAIIVFIVVIMIFLPYMYIPKGEWLGYYMQALPR